MMRLSTATEPGDPGKPNEDWVYANHGLIIVLDGATARTETGCSHGVAWYADTLGMTIAQMASDRRVQLGNVVTNAILATAEAHRECDLSHPGTPSAAIAIVRISDETLEYLVLGDTTVVIDTEQRTHVVSDDRVEATATDERAEAKRHPFGTAEKQAALLMMKHAELAQRNRPGGFWVAAADPTVAVHSLRGELSCSHIRRIGVFTDGAARIVCLFGLIDWPAVLDVLEGHGPTEIIRRVRAIEAADPTGARWPRNKASDDATIVCAL